MFESGMGRGRSAWALVQPIVSQFARTVVYDRAGFGPSDPDPSGRGFSRLRDDHLAILDAAVDGPAVLVGHSYGGPIVRSGALHRPDITSGVVLVDEVNELITPRRMLAGMRGASLVYAAQMLLARVGLLRWALSRTYYRRLSGPALEVALDEESTLTAAIAARDEWRAFGESFTRLHENGPLVPAGALTSISTKRVDDEDARRERDFMSNAHLELVSLADDGRHVFAEGRSHHLQFSEPALVADEIRRSVEQVGVA
ncbi:hypothetical protein Rrhod_1059 [Rhodococcus rhodnii LMG 5362]|uniref:AB hydrolase-1 domain-containing protein n=1 Tax=Rhodococcus rhodnii LMG 5362 TaxID=1273125 RepID=R7WQQ6_9NOCA|nr:alpha/beta hydrolase [Rhodococcus rhodnii]EOM77648.1 hypothetical protein Rrhod_1059 [Rhodococcus rhodnii LMG 5362]